MKAAAAALLLVVSYAMRGPHIIQNSRIENLGSHRGNSEGVEMEAWER